MRKFKKNIEGIFRKNVKVTYKSKFESRVKVESKVKIKSESIFRRKSAFTLIELIIVLSILSLSIFIFSPNIEVYSNYKASIDMKYTVGGIEEFINTAKVYGRLKEKGILIKINNREIIFTADTKIIESFKFPESISSVRIMTGDKISINSLGKATANSIVIQSHNQEIQQEIITVKVGTSYASKQKK